MSAGLPSCIVDPCETLPLQFSEHCAEHVPELEVWQKEALQEIYYYGCVGGNFEACDLRGTDFKKGTFSKSNFRNSRLTGCELAEVVAIAVDFSESDLTDLRASKANLSESRFDGANLQGAQMERANVEGTDFKNATIARANLKHALCHGMHAEGADFKGSDLSDTTFTDADLKNADLSGCNLARANFCGADLSGAKLDGVTGQELVIVNEKTVGAEALRAR